MKVKSIYSIIKEFIKDLRVILIDSFFWQKVFLHGNSMAANKQHYLRERHVSEKMYKTRTSSKIVEIFPRPFVIIRLSAIFT